MIRTRVVAGCMTGTSLDGLDVVVARIDGQGLTSKATLLATRSVNLGRLALPLRQAAEQVPLTAAVFADLARRLALLHVRALKDLVPKFGVTLVTAHGQTIYHQPPLSWQLFNAAVLANGLGVAVMHDLRAADVAAGGQGAPLTPLADWLLYRQARRTVAVLNLGGFANATILPPSGVEQVRGADLCACNHVLDAVARTALGRSFDLNGRAALSAQADPIACKNLQGRLQRQRRSQRSLGTGDEAGAWLTDFSHLPGPVLARSAVAAIAATIRAGLPPHDRLILAGGGARNRALVQELSKAGPVIDSGELGIPVMYREALGFAVLGALAFDHQAVSLRHVTGVARPPLGGALVPAPYPSRKPSP